jgi:hypothetical protein
MPRLTVVALLLLAGCFKTVAVNAPQGEKLEVMKGAFPHDVLDGVLKKVVNDRGRVDYKTLAADRAALQKYLVAVAEVSPHANPELFPKPEDRLAYWINAYNAYVLYAVTERPTMKSVNDDATNFFYFTKYDFGNEEISLYKLENDVVRKEFSEPRIHFALNCASAACPELPPEAFMPERLEDQLAREAREFCANPDKVRLNGTTVEVSQIFEWYGDDFAALGGPVEFCRKWGRTDLPEKADVEFIPYDWTLNAQTGRALFE